MYDELINKKVLVIVSTRADRVMEYVGILVKEDSDVLVLHDVSINIQLSNMQTSIFGHNTGSFYENSMPVAIINKRYIVSVIVRN